MSIETFDAAGAAPAWLGEHATALTAALARTGAVLVRGLAVRTAADLAGARDALGLTEATGQERFAPTTDLGGGVTSAPEWGADREMCLHHEQSFAVTAPRVLLMACAAEPTEGGETLLGDTRAVLTELPADLLARFRAHGWVLERNFRQYFGLPWGTAFGVTDPDALAGYGADRGMTTEWRADGSLHTAQHRPAVVRHPVTGEECWYNDAAFFSQWSIDEAERKVLLSSFGPGGIPFNTALGDGTELTADEWQSVLDAYDAVTVRLRWRVGDLLLVDNVLTAHGRAPYAGPREILVAAADAVPVEGV
ncbi:TauD/TfdA family dioxygenase [Longispora sp. K20-0274]|uniref:TauD/TfdA family dioxygenase n=1 Tax=Longispora sp. K20-0274 TaxID=3088255 RepID=UPI00399A6D13